MPDHWALLTYEPTRTATGYRIVITTDVASHLWMRWTTVLPQEHLIAVRRRGVVFRSDKYFCFDVFTDNEQEEAGDTLEHTFIKEPWPICETRYFYFIGNIAGVESPSTTAIFTLHRIAIEETFVFYPDAHPEVTSVDGWAEQDELYLVGGTWGQVRDGGGTYADDDGIALHVGITPASPSNMWWHIRRSILLFDTSPLPDDSVINSAILQLYIITKVNTMGLPSPAFGVYSSNPSSNVGLEAGDYNSLGTTRYSNIVPYGDLTSHETHDWILNAAGIAAISKVGITKFGVREATYDAANFEPDWVAGGLPCYISIASADHLTAPSPVLIVKVKPS